jgi:hypothetical protein
MILLLAVCSAGALGQTTKFRTGIFLHHSVGGVLWDRSQYSNLTPPTTIPAEIAAYNAAHHFTGTDAFSLQETYAPDPQSLNDNNWYRWDRIFHNDDSYVNLSSLLTEPIVIVKTCYISQQMMSSADSIGAYEVHVRNIVKVMEQHPEHFFVLWNNYPAATDGAADRAAWSAQFSVWMKDVLAAGKDSYGPFPKNVYVFDVFRKLADPTTGVCPAEYGSFDEGPGGDHPSNAAVALLDPVMVAETFNAAIAYEQEVNGAASVNPVVPFRFGLTQNFPNPFNPSTTIRYQLASRVPVSLRVFDLLGRNLATLVNGVQEPGDHEVSFDASHLASGAYFYRLQAGEYVAVKTMSVVK